MSVISLCLLFLLISFQIHWVRSQKSLPAAEALSPVDDCNGIFLQYVYTFVFILKPTVKTHQPYRFESTLNIVNNGLDELSSWRVFVGFQHDEFLVSASNAVLDDGTSLSAAVGNGTVFAGFPNSDLKTAIETASDSTQTSARVELVGTQFGVGLRSAPMPSNISLVNDGFICPKPSMQALILTSFSFAETYNLHYFD